MKIFRSLPIWVFSLSLGNFVHAQSTSGFTELKADMSSAVDSMSKLTQVIVDSLFSFSELGFQEFQTQAYLTGILAESDFDIELGVAGIPSSWWASWGSGSPVIALGSDVDGIPRASQMPGVAYRQPITAPEIQELRGVSSTSVLRTLLENRLIRIAGRKEVGGRPFIYRTTREFLVRFGLNRIKDLPALEDANRRRTQIIDLRL